MNRLLILLFKEISSASSNIGLKESTIISLSDDELNVNPVSIQQFTNDLYPPTSSTSSKERTSMIALSTKSTRNLPYIVPSFALEVNEARKKAGLKAIAGESIPQSPFKLKRIATTLSPTQLPSGITFKCTI